MSLTSISLGLRDLFRDPKRRHEFFKTLTQDDIAAQIRDLRKKRGMNQTQFAQAADMKQSAVSRIEQAEYASWTLATLFKVAAALDARWRVVLQPAEDAVRELEWLDQNNNQTLLIDQDTNIQGTTTQKDRSGTDRGVNRSAAAFNAAEPRIQQHIQLS